MKFTLLLLVVQFFSCSQSYVKSYTDLESAFTDWYFKFHPVESTHYGSDEYNSTFRRLDVDAREEYLADVQRFRIELSQIDETKLPQIEFVNHLILTQFLASEVYYLQTERRYEWDASLYPEMIYNGIVALVDLDYLDMNGRTYALEQRLRVSISVLDDAYQNLKFYSNFHKLKLSKVINALNILLDELPLKVMSDNQTLDKIDSHIRSLQRALKEYKQWVDDDYTTLETYDHKIDPSEIANLFTHRVGEAYSIGKISPLAEKRIVRIQNQLFDLSLPFYLQKNDEPVWVDRDDSLLVIYWVLEDLDNNAVSPQEYISSVYAASKKIQDELRKNRELFILSTPNIQIRFDETYSLSTTLTRVGRFQLNSHNTDVEYLVKPLGEGVTSDSIVNKYELDIMVMKDLSPGELQFQQSLSKNSELLRQIIQNNVTKYGWQQYASSYFIDSGFGGGENYAYALTSLYHALKIAGLSWMELQLGYHEVDATQISLELASKINISPMEAKVYIDNFHEAPFHFTQQFIGGIEMERLLTDYKRKNENIISLRKFHSRILSEGSIPIFQLRKIILN